MNGMGISLGGGLLGGESIPVIEAVLAFAGQRQSVLLNNIANWNTPHFQAQDLPERHFQGVLREAILNRTSGAQSLRLAQDHSVHPDGAGSFRIRPATVLSGSTRHDGNTVMIDDEQAKLLKNGLTAQVFNRLLSRKFRMLRTAISERLV